MTCRYDKAADAYLIDGEPCKVDAYGDPTKHCTARRTCPVHIGPDELTCPRCLARTRADVRQVVALASLMLPAAIDEGVNSEAAHLAGPAANPLAVDALRFYVHGHATHAYRQGRIDGDTLTKILDALPDDDERHPYSVLTRWQLMLSEDYGHDLPRRLTVEGAGAYLERHLHRIAQDPEQDFALLAREVRRVRNHLESVLHNSSKPERGAPCETCAAEGHFARLVREYSHWCDDPDCCQQHVADDSRDRWVCPRNREHWWTHASYSNYLEERRGA